MPNFSATHKANALDIVNQASLECGHSIPLLLWIHIVKILQ